MKSDTELRVKLFILSRVRGGIGRRLGIHVGKDYSHLCIPSKELFDMLDDLEREAYLEAEKQSEHEENTPVDFTTAHIPYDHSTKQRHADIRLNDHSLIEDIAWLIFFCAATAILILAFFTL